MADEGTTSLSDILTTVQQGVSAVNNLGQLLTRATLNSSSLQVTLSSTIFVTTASTLFLPSSASFVTTVNTGVGLTGGPITISGTLAVSLSNLSNVLSSDRAISSSPLFTDGPSVSQGTSGVWLATGSVTVTSTAVTNIFAKLWDGTTVVNSANPQILVAGGRTQASLSGVFSSPSSNIKISVTDLEGIPATMEANRSGLGRDSVINVVRIG